MQSLDWNDLRYFLALHRAGKLKPAARATGASETTVTRRIRALEQALGAPLFLRGAAGRYEPTDTALRILPHAEAVENETRTIRETTGAAAHDIAGTVRISAVPIIVNRVLVPHLQALARTHPQLTVELVPNADNLDLSRREADLALRFARPDSGGLRTKARKLGEMAFGPYAARAAPPDGTDAPGWITYDDARSGLPQARWLDTAANRPATTRAGLKVADAETALEAVARGLGQSLLPRMIADADPRLRPLDVDGNERLPVRELWLLSHADQGARASVAAAVDWLAALPWR